MEKAKEVVNLALSTGTGNAQAPSVSRCTFRKGGDLIGETWKTYLQVGVTKCI